MTSSETPRPRVRLYVEAPLGAGLAAPLDARQVHYLKNVMRLGPGDELSVFNGETGEWHAAIETLERSAGTLRVGLQARRQEADADLWLVFAPVKKARAAAIVEKASELGVARILPVLTERTAVRALNPERARTIAIEAAEQCGRLTVPEIDAPAPLAAALERWPEGRRLLFCDESGVSPPVAEALAAADGALPKAPWGVLIGPEGGFSGKEHSFIAAHPAAVPAGLGPRILRADTAAIAALALVQAHLADWR